MRSARIDNTGVESLMGWTYLTLSVRRKIMWKDLAGAYPHTSSVFSRVAEEMSLLFPGAKVDLDL